MSRSRDSLPASMRHGLRASIRNNFNAFGFSVMITASFGVSTIKLGDPTVGEAFLYVAGAVAGFTAIEAIVSGGFRHGMRGEPTDVVALGTAFSFLSTGLGLGAATLVVELVASSPGWLLAPLAATSVYVVTAAFEMALAEQIKGRREG